MSEIVCARAARIVIIRGDGISGTAKPQGANGSYSVGRRPSDSDAGGKLLKVASGIGSANDSGGSDSGRRGRCLLLRSRATIRAGKMLARGHAAKKFQKIFVTAQAAMNRRGRLPEHQLNTATMHVERQWQMSATANVSG